jgi:hypothetical protein
MISNSTREFLRVIGWLACAAWLGYGIWHEVFNQDASQFGFRAPVVEAEMKNCTSDEMRERYECKEQAILANERLQFIGASGRAVLIFGPPILVWVVARRVLRLRPGDSATPLPPSIQKWRVK